MRLLCCATIPVLGERIWSRQISSKPTVARSPPRAIWPEGPRRWRALNAGRALEAMGRALAASGLTRLWVGLTANYRPQCFN
jgi:hypothetical protein